METDRPTDRELVVEARTGHSRGAAVEMMRRLKDAVIQLDHTTTKQQDKIFRLTWWIAAFTFVMLALVFLQVLQIFVPNLWLQKSLNMFSCL